MRTGTGTGTGKGTGRMRDKYREKILTHYLYFNNGILAVPLPQFEGLKLDKNNIVTSTAPSNNSPAIATQQQQASGPAMKVTPAEREKYISIFRVHQPVDGVLDATNAKNIFMKSKLSNETLGQIW